MPTKTADNLSVLMFGWELPPYNTGGLGVACYGLAQGLSRRGIAINFGLPRRLSSNVSFMKLMDHQLQDVSVVGINSLLKSYQANKDYQQRYHHYQHLNKYGHDMYQEAMRFADIAQDWAQKTPHHLIHAHDWMSYPAGIKAAKKSGHPFVAHIHATEYDRTGGNNDPRIAEIEYQGLKQADRVIAVSQYTKDTVTQNYKIPADKITVVHNGVDIEDFKPTFIREVFPYDNIVLYVGRLTFQKGVEYFLRAAHTVLAHHPNTVFLVVGEGDMYERHVLEAATLGIGQRVVFTGFLSGQKLKSVYQMADVFVMPSVSEPYGIVALEAIASGVPAIISKQSGVSETISQVYKVDFWDTDQMAGYINTILSFPHHAGWRTALAQKEAQKMTWQCSAQKTHRVYRELVAK